jgi:hypothetical protein
MSDTFYSIPASVSGRMPHPNGTHHVVSLSMNEGDHAGNVALHLPNDHEALQHLALGKTVTVHLAHHTPTHTPATHVAPVEAPVAPERVAVEPVSQVHSLSGHATPAAGLFNYAERPTAIYPVVTDEDEDFDGN